MEIHFIRFYKKQTKKLSPGLVFILENPSLKVTLLSLFSRKEYPFLSASRAVSPEGSRSTASGNRVDDFRLFFTAEIDISTCVGRSIVKVKTLFDQS